MNAARRAEPLPCYDHLFGESDTSCPSQVQRVAVRVACAEPGESEASEHPTLPVARQAREASSVGDAPLALVDIAHAAAVPHRRTTRSDVGDLGPLSQIPRISSSLSDLGLDGIDHRDAFILGLVDGEATLRSIVAESCLPAEQVLGVLAEFVTDGRITLAGTRQS
jgi:hypothetical protein